MAAGHGGVAGGPAAPSRREALAGEVLDLARRVVPADGPIDLVLGPVPPPSEVPAGHARVVIAGPDALARLLWPLTPDALAEAYLRGDIEIEGDIGAAIAAGQSFVLRRLGRDAPRLARLALELRRGTAAAQPLARVARLSGRRHSRARDLAAVRFHYDIGDEFFALWLDRRMVYSCAYFETPETPLDAAQEAKLDLVCRKLDLRPGTRLLDIGCGWGSLVAFAAERYEARAVGVTLSAVQAAWATADLRRRGLEKQATTVVRDYRDLRGLGPFDAIASIGMFEHVGRERFDAYFRAAFRALRPGGLFLNHGIATTATGRDLLPVRGRLGDGGFVGRYVFPDGDLVTVEEAIGHARRAGFELLDVQSLRPHYALTLRAWVERLEASAERARALAGEEVYRTWRLYMSAARAGFAAGSHDVAQLLLARPGRGGPAELPLRPWWHGRSGTA